MSEIRVDLITEKTADGGVTIKSTGTGDNKPTLLTLQTSEADIAANDVLGKIQFQAPDEGTGTDAILVSAAIQARSEGDFAADANATAIDFMVGASEAAATKMSLSSTGVLTAVELDISGNVDVDGTTNLDVVDIDGALTQDGGAVFNEASADVDFRVESNGNANMLFVDGGNNRVGVGCNPSADFHVDSSGGGVIRISRNGTSTSNFMALESDGTNGTVKAIQSLIVSAGGSEQLRIGSNLATGAETAPDVASGGLCLQLNANDNAILSFKSSDVGAGANVSGLEADTFALYKKLSANEGGLLTQIQSEIGECYETRALIAEATAVTDKNTGANAPIIFKSAATHSGGVRALSNAATNANLFIISDHTTRRFIFDSEGDLHSDSSNTTFDSYEDAHLVRAFDLSHGRGVINSKFDEFIKYQHEDLAKAGLVGRENDGSPNHFINMSGFQRLHNGAIWQQYEKHQKLASAFYKLATKTIGKEEADKLLTEEEIQLLN